MAAKPKVVRFQPPVPDDDDDDHECPKCPPVGAPAWLATFADIATNLMAFFVLILGFAKFDEPSFSKMAGSMRETFGFQRVLQETSGDTVIEIGLPPADPDGGEPDERSDTGGPNDSGSTASAPGKEAADQVAAALAKAMEQGRIEVQSASGGVVIKLPEAQGPQAAQALAGAIAKAAGIELAPVEGDPGTESAPGASKPLEGQATGAGTESAGSGGDEGAGLRKAVRAEMDSLVLKNALEAEIEQGLIKVEHLDGKVLVRVGAGGSFTSGSDELSGEARAVMATIAASTDRPGRKIVITGHTDDVPISGGAFRDNMALAAARAASVGRELVQSGAVNADQITAVSRGESDPIADNATEEGRAQNRRIEIEISYD
ncbi:OmpA family protein [Cereibacter sphaeroides]|uniref:OmpA family protein n=1 Tax=Cereibacter sphaeroides TaxID=1063 RepID=UPI001F36ECFE|nr:OmpA family protein [Cereibacter sphaeroides]MCE6950634.1 OmpA family protein [Cereibacter sphaeroides]